MNLFVLGRRAILLFAVLFTLSVAPRPAVAQITNTNVTVITNFTEQVFYDAVKLGGTIQFSTNSLITLTDTIHITNDVVIDGKISHVISKTNDVVVGGVTNPVVVTTTNFFTLAEMVGFKGGSNGFRLFDIATNVTVTFDHIQFVSGGSARGGAVYNSGTASWLACYFSANTARGNKGATGAPGHRDGGNGGSGGAGFGGAIFNLNLGTVSQCYFVANQALGGDGGNGGNGAADSLFGGNGGNGGNGGAGLGGAIYNRGKLSIAETTFERNSTTGGDGGFAGVGGSAPFPGTPGLAGSGASASGGAIYNLGFITNATSLFVSNHAEGGSSAPQFGLANGAAGGLGSGGGIYNSNTFVLVNSTVVSNLCFGGGGGGVQAGATIYGGTGGSALGGGLYNAARTLLTNCTFAYGALTNGLGGVSLAGDARNGAPGSRRGGNICNALGTTKLQNCIVAGGFPTNSAGLLTDLGYNLSSDRSCAFAKPGSRNNVDPKLERLADNGGFTFTLALGLSSPAIDKGTNQGPPFDQRGTNRVDGYYDIGAFEALSPYKVSGHVLYGTNAPASGLTITVVGTNEFIGTNMTQSVTNFSVTNDFEGFFTFTVGKGTFTITPQAVDTNVLFFKPVITNINSDIADLIIKATSIVVRGKITNSAGGGLSGITMTVTNPVLGQFLSITSSVGGLYAFNGVAPGHSIVTPHTPNAIFVPSSWTNTGTKLTNIVNFLRIPTYTVAGLVTNKTTHTTIADVILQLQNSTRTLLSTSDFRGKYVFSNVVSGSYVLKSLNTNLVFTPATRTINVVSNIPSLNLFATNTTVAP